MNNRISTSFLIAFLLFVSTTLAVVNTVSHSKTLSSETIITCMGTEPTDAWVPCSFYKSCGNESDCTGVMSVDISGCGFSSPPSFVSTSIMTGVSSWLNTGYNSIYNLNTNSFDVYIAYTPWNCVPLDFNTLDWTLGWFATGF